MWGQNAGQFIAIQQIRAFAEANWTDLTSEPISWLQKPEPSPAGGISLAWQLGTYLFSATAGGAPAYPATGKVLLDVEGCRVFRLPG